MKWPLRQVPRHAFYLDEAASCKHLRVTLARCQPVLPAGRIHESARPGCRPDAGSVPGSLPSTAPGVPQHESDCPSNNFPQSGASLVLSPFPTPPRISGAGLTLKPLSQSLLLAETQRRWLDPHLRKIARVAAWEADGTGPWKCGCRCHDCAFFHPESRLSGAPPPCSPQRLPTTQSSAKARPVSLLNISCNHPLPPARTGASHHQPE